MVFEVYVISTSVEPELEKATGSPTIIEPHSVFVEQLSSSLHSDFLDWYAAGAEK